MVIATNLGFPRIGNKRQLKKATENYWRGKISLSELESEGKALRQTHWQLQKETGLDHIPAGDFSFYDQILDMSALLGCVPARYNWNGDKVDLDTYFAMARGNEQAPAMEMTKWFNTNYHYIVPEFEDGQDFKISSDKIFSEITEAQALGITPRPVIIGPLSYIALGKIKSDKINRADLITKLLPVYDEILARFSNMGIEWVQIDEPFLVMDLCDGVRQAYRQCYEHLKSNTNLKILIATYFESLRNNQELALSLKADALHIDLIRGEGQLDNVLENLPNDKTLSIGLVDGRNIWKNDLTSTIQTAQRVIDKIGSHRVMIAPSCSLLHSPVDLDQEDQLDNEIKSWLAFAAQKVKEISLISKALNDGLDSVKTDIDENAAAIASRKNSSLIHRPEITQRMKDITAEMALRKSPYAQRAIAQKEKLDLPAYPTTTIGSFPQTTEIRQARAAYKKGELPRAGYQSAMEKEIADVVRYQEDIGIDVLVHGEAERNDMVEYFGERLDGFAFTRFGWVQSYGSRCVKPPIIYGDVQRPEAMTVKWSSYAQSLTDKPMKGMLTGPVTIMFWSFIRDDQPIEDTCRQIGLAIRDEVSDLEQAGINVIQIDEPAFREGLPLPKNQWASYLKWAVECFKIASCSVADTTQIHTHMCYSEFNDIIESIAALDADVISIETSRSQMELLDAFAEFKYPNEIGPGVYDIHSPRIPQTADMQQLLEKANNVLSEPQIWVNPDCGLKTRGWAEVKPALENMVSAAKALRKKSKASKAA